MKRGSWIRRRTPLARRSRKSVALQPLKDLAREIVLARDGYRCRRCGRGKQPGRGGGLQAAHIFPKGQWKGMEFDLDNIITLCAYPCHLGSGGWHKDPLEAQRWAAEHLGQDFLDRLRMTAMARQNQRRDLKLIRIYLEQEKARLGAMEAPSP